MFDVTHICTERLQHVVVPMAAQQISGRSSLERMVSVACVAGQQIAIDARIEMCQGCVIECICDRGCGRTLKRQETYERWYW